MKCPRCNQNLFKSMGYECASCGWKRDDAAYRLRAKLNPSISKPPTKGRPIGYAPSRDNHQLT